MPLALELNDRFYGISHLISQGFNTVIILRDETQRKFSKVFKNFDFPANLFYRKVLMGCFNGATFQTRVSSIRSSSYFVQLNKTISPGLNHLLDLFLLYNRAVVDFNGLINFITTGMKTTCRVILNDEFSVRHSCSASDMV
jgi:hypothetical protein